MPERAAAPLLIVGAGPIGRGVLAPRLLGAGREVVLIDRDEDLIRSLRRQGFYRVCEVDGGRGSWRTIEGFRCFTPDEFGPAHQARHVLLCVGVDNVEAAGQAIGRPSRLLCCENSLTIARRIERQMPMTSVEFAVPDTIAFSAPSAADPAGVVLSRGAMHIERTTGEWLPELDECEDIEYAWRRKSLLHNTPHAVLAFIAKAAGAKVLPEALARSRFRAFMDELLEVLTTAAVMQLGFPPRDARHYAERERERLADSALADPVARITRSPERKFDKDERFFSTIQLIERAGGDPYPVDLGAACCALEIARLAGTTPSSLEACGDFTELHSGLDRQRPQTERVAFLLHALVQGLNPLSPRLRARARRSRPRPRAWRS